MGSVTQATAVRFARDTTSLARVSGNLLRQMQCLERIGGTHPSRVALQARVSVVTTANGDDDHPDLTCHHNYSGWGQTRCRAFPVEVLMLRLIDEGQPVFRGTGCVPREDCPVQRS